MSRRTLAKGAARSLPAAAVVAAAPAYAQSLQIDPGINGWVLNRCKARATAGTRSPSSRIPRTPSPRPTARPTGCTFYDIQPGATITNARLTYWLRGDVRADWTSLGGHSSCWGTPTRGTPTVKSDGNT